jgi:hypothetical protein
VAGSVRKNRGSIVAIGSQVGKLWRAVFPTSTKSLMEDGDTVIVKETDDNWYSTPVTVFNTTQYKYYTYDYTTYRQGVRDDKFVLDKELTELGFDGTEDTDWENLEYSF